MLKYLRIFFFQYVLIYFCLSFPAFFMSSSSLWLIIMLLILFAYDYYQKKKSKLTKEHVYLNIITAIITLSIFTICLLISKGYISSAIWNVFYITIFPFFPLTLFSLMTGSYFSYFYSIIGILFFQAYMTYFMVKPFDFKKKLIPMTALCICLFLFNIYLYNHSDPIRYKGGHHFQYMNGYSSTDLTDYTPYAQKSQLIKLNEPSTFIIDNELDMPYLDGAEACYPVYSAVAKAVYKDIDKIEEKYKNEYQYTNGKIVSFTNTSIGYSRLFQNEIDMFFGAKPSASQLEEAKKLGVELEYTPIGKEAFVFFVNEKNPISNLSTQNIKDIYHGDINNWNEVGGKDNKIIAFQRPERSGSQAMMNYFMGETSLKEPLTYEMVSGMGGIIEEVAEYKNEDGAIGYTFRYFLEGLNQEDHVKILSIDGIYPSTENIKNQSYPLSTYLYCVTLKSNKKENVKKLKEYLLSPQGQYIIEQTGYCGLK